MNFAAAVRGKPEYVHQAAEQAKLASVAEAVALSFAGAASSSLPDGGNHQPRGSLRAPTRNIDEQHTKVGYTALHQACFLGHATVVATLLAQNARLDVVDRDGRTPLELAIWHSHSECVMVLTNYLHGIEEAAAARVAAAERDRLDGGDGLLNQVVPNSPKLLAPKLLSREVLKIDARKVAEEADARAAMALAKRREGMLQSPKVAAGGTLSPRSPRDHPQQQHNSHATANGATTTMMIQYRRRDKFERPPKLTELHRTNGVIQDVKQFMQSSKKQLGDDTFGDAILAGFRQQRRLHVEPDAHYRAAPHLQQRQQQPQHLPQSQDKTKKHDKQQQQQQQHLQKNQTQKKKNANRSNRTHQKKDTAAGGESSKMPAVLLPGKRNGSDGDRMRRLQHQHQPQQRRNAAGGVSKAPAAGQQGGGGGGGGRGDGGVEGGGDSDDEPSSAEDAEAVFDSDSLYISLRGAGARRRASSAVP
jgi:hypothetical protein